MSQKSTIEEESEETTADEPDTEPVAESVVEIAPAAFVPAGDQLERIPVALNYGIIQRFSEGLYASPNKAFEELVTNAYDAGAGRVWVVLPEDLEPEDTAIAVIDDGISMNVEGLKHLWLIGESKKREWEPVAGRDPVGKFGIGKLATYVLAESLTYICKRADTYLAVTMDFSKVTGRLASGAGVILNVVELDSEGARAALVAALGEKKPISDLFGDEPPENWTAAIMTNLKERARTLNRGSLHWVLGSALPLNPQFQLWINRKKIKSSKAAGKVVWRFKVGVNDISRKTPYADSASAEGVRLPDAGLVTGYAELYELPLERGASEGQGRSHGFFVRVKQRLVNLEDETFGIDTELSHGVFTRIHVVVNVDGLDEGITATRESVKESPALTQVRNYLLAVFNEARAVWRTLEKAHPDTLTAGQRIAAPPPALSQGPLRRVLARVVEGEDEPLLAELIVSLPEDAGDVEKALDPEQNLLTDIRLESRGFDARIAAFDAGRRMILVNRDHPFIDNYADSKGALEPLQLFAATELFTATYLLDEGIAAGTVRAVIDRRDAYLRALVDVYPRSASVVARRLRDAVGDEKALEDAVGDVMHYLGFHMKRRSGSGKTDVVAWALLGHREEEGVTATYGVVCDAKSSSAKEIKAAKVNPGQLKRHKRKEAADFIMVVAPGFEGAKADDSSIAEYCTEARITPIRAEDLARVVELFPSRVITPATLHPLFDQHTPKASEEFVDKLEKEAPARPYVSADLVLSLIEEASRGRAPVAIDALPQMLRMETEGSIEYTIPEVTAMIDGLRSLAPTGIWTNQRFVALQTSPANIKAEIRENIEELPDESIRAAREALEN